MSELYNVTNDPLTGGGIFSVMDPLGVPWEDENIALELDMAYYGNYSGSKITSPLVDKLLEGGVLSDAAMLKLAHVLLSINSQRWAKEWETLFADYDPISNYDMIEEMSEEGETNYGHTRTRTDNLAHNETRTDNLAHSETRTDNLTHTVDGSEVEIPNVIMTEQESVHAFNSGSDQPSTKTTQTPQGNNRTDNDVTEHDTGTQSTQGTNTGTQAVQGTNSGTQSENEGGSDSNSRDYTLTRRGNIGVTTSQQMLTSERELWMWNYFTEVVFPDVDKVLTTPVYLVSVLDEESAGGITPTGRKNIYLNGVYDVTNYAEALVNVDNTYTEADEGKVVDNGQLVEQGELEIYHNGPYNTTLYNKVVANVLNSYSVEDLGKVVATVGLNRRLVEQTDRTITENGTYDTTTNNEIIVNVPRDILSGGEPPAASVGNNGTIYLQYEDIPELPTGYTPVKYIENTSQGAYINTGYLFKADSRVDLDVNVSGGNTYPSPFGCRIGTTGSGVNQWYFSLDGTSVYYAMGNNERRTTSSWVYNTLIHISAKAGEAALTGGVVTTIYTNEQSGIGTIPLYLFGVNLNDAPWSSGWAIMKIYKCRIYEGDTLIKDFVPVKRDSDDVVGLYERVDDVFYTNEGSGAFIAGPEQEGEPIEYAYLKVNGAWQNLIGSDVDDVIN